MSGSALRSLVCGLTVLGGCRGCDHGDASVAELVSANKIVEKNAVRQGVVWHPAQVGDGFAEADALRTGPLSRARVKLAGGGGLRLSENTVIRFGKNQRGLQVEAGEAEVEAAAGNLLLDMAIGQARLDQSSRARISAVGGKVRFDVLVGSAKFEEGDGTLTNVKAGEGFSVDIGAAVLEKDEPKAQPDAAPVDAKPLASGEAVQATIKGKGVKTRASDGREWQTLDPGNARLAVGAQLSVPARASVRLERGDERATIVGAAEVVIGGPGGAIVDARVGRADVTTKKDSVSVVVPGGVIQIKSDSAASIDVGRDQVAVIDVKAGSVDVRGAKDSETVESGESVALGADGAVDVHNLKDTPPPEGDPVLAITVGASPTIHDPAPPTILKLEFGERCAGRGTVELVKGRGSFRRPLIRASGRGSAPVELAAGRYKYRGRCVGSSAVKTGAIKVLKDSGGAPLPKKAPSSLLDADGRKYTVLYQNLLPVVTLRWRGAPKASTYELHIAGEKGAPDVKRTGQPKFTFDSGALLEGAYTYWFGAGSSKTPETSLRIRFDNAAATAYVRSPSVNEAWNGQTLHVEGAALEGWAVSVGDQKLVIDRQRRFSQDVPRPEGALAIRFYRSGKGVHFYIRRPGGK